MRVESPRELRRDAEALVEALTEYSRGVASGSYEDVGSLLYTLVPSEPDKAPEIPVTPALLLCFEPRKALAVYLAHTLCADFNRNFGFGSHSGESLKWDNPDLQQFFLGLGRFTHGLLDPTSPYREEVREEIGKTVQALAGLKEWATKEFLPTK